MKQLFLPVFGHSRYAGLQKQVFGVGGARWFDGPPLHYTHGLVSYAHWSGPSVWPADAYIFGDSGGFTLVTDRPQDRPAAGTGRGGFYSSQKRTRRGSIDPVLLMHWQISMVTVGALLDRPPYVDRHAPGAQRYNRYNWEEAVAQTVGYTKRGLRVYEKARAQGTKFRWWGVLHGGTEEEQIAWHRQVAQVYPFADKGEGWAIRSEPSVNSFSVAQALRVCQRLNITRAHFLAATSQQVVAVLVALGPEAGLDLVTYDSAYATKAANNRQILHLNDANFTHHSGATDYEGWSIWKEEKDDSHVREFLQHECPCECCVWMRKRTAEEKAGQEALRMAGWGGWFGTWANMHNFLMQRELFEKFQTWAQQDPKMFLEAILGPAEAVRARRIFHGQEALRAPIGAERSLLDYI